jgi:hypothetical protein
MMARAKAAWSVFAPEAFSLNNFAAPAAFSSSIWAAVS